MKNALLKKGVGVENDDIKIVDLVRMAYEENGLYRRMFCPFCGFTKIKSCFIKTQEREFNCLNCRARGEFKLI